MHKPFRTPTGQTGRDAYTFELAAIANARRELDSRMSRLMDAMSAELPESATYQMSIATDAYPDATLTGDIATIRKQLDTCRTADSHCIDFVREILATLSA